MLYSAFLRYTSVFSQFDCIPKIHIPDSANGNQQELYPCSSLLSGTHHNWKHSLPISTYVTLFGTIELLRYNSCVHLKICCFFVVAQVIKSRNECLVWVDIEMKVYINVIAIELRSMCRVSWFNHGESHETQNVGLVSWCWMCLLISFLMLHYLYCMLAYYVVYVV